MQIKHHISLKPYNTFGIDVAAEKFVSVHSVHELITVLKAYKNIPKLILGGGSNILLTQPVKGLVVHLNLKGKSILFENESTVHIKGQAGENWHDFVLYCLDNNYGGIENLSLIPGNLGTAPIQNIGAYGIELKDVMVSCEVLDLSTYSIKTLANQDCGFGYRDSIFKGKKRGDYIILSVTLELTKRNHKLHTAYGAIANQLKAMGIEKPTIKDVSNAVISIRQSKLPDPKKIGNSGSFFKNPILSIDHFNTLKSIFPTIPNYPASEKTVKVPAGWLIEEAGFKGKTLGNYGVHKKQALVLVNYGGAKGSDILDLARLIQKTIDRIFNIKIETEVNIL